MTNLSIIVPVYNTEKYIKRCFESLKNLKDTEIIVINDGSADNSENIINEFAKSQSNIIYYKKENSGIADTRNFGMEKATGKYIMFVDSDDYIDDDLIPELEPFMKENIDVIKFKLRRVDEFGKELEIVDRC